MKLPILLVIGLLLVGSVSASWWNASFNNRVQINISNWTCYNSYCQFPITVGNVTNIPTAYQYLPSITGERGYVFTPTNNITLYGIRTTTGVTANYVAVYNSAGTQLQNQTITNGIGAITQSLVAGQFYYIMVGKTSSWTGQYAPVLTAYPWSVNYGTINKASSKDPALANDTANSGYIDKLFFSPLNQYGNGSDMRFTDSSDATETGYWFEDNDFAAGTGKIWVNASNQTSTLYLYYNATGTITNKSNVDTTFLFGEDCSGTSLNTTKWTEENHTNGETLTIGGGLCNLTNSDGTVRYKGLTANSAFTSGDRVSLFSKVKTISSATDETSWIFMYYGAGGQANIANGWFYDPYNSGPSKRVQLTGASTSENLTVSYSFPEVQRIDYNFNASTMSGYNALSGGTYRNFSSVSMQAGTTKRVRVWHQGAGAQTLALDYVFATPTGIGTPSFTFGVEESGAYGRTLTVQTSNPQNSFLQDSMNLTITLVNPNVSTLNLSATTATLVYNGTAYSPTRTTNSTSAFFSYVVTPPYLSPLTSATVNYYWLVNYTQNNITENISSSTVVNSGGLLPCGGITNTSAYNILLVDDVSGSLVNSTINLYTTYSLPFATMSSSYLTTTNNWTLCIYPNMSIPITNTLTVNASGYTTKVFTDAFNASGTLSTRTYLMSNVSAVSLVTLRVVQSPANSISGVAIKVYRLTLPSTYQLTDSCTTDAGGNCNVHLIPTTTQYVYNFTYAGTDYSFGAETVTCTTYGCFRTFTIGSSGNIPIQISLRGACSFSSSSSNLQCNATDSSATITRLTLQAYYFGNTTAMCSQTTAASSASLTCNLPNGSIYTYSFYGNDATGGQYILQTGTIDRSTSSAGFGRSGWLAALLLLGVAALMFSGNLALSIGGAVVGLFAAMLLGIIPLTGNFVAVVGIGVVALAMAYRLKV